MRLETWRIAVVPVCQTDDLAHMSSTRLFGIERLQDIEPIAIEKERVFSKQPRQLRHRGVIRGNLLGFELGKRSLDLCGRQLHRKLPSVGGFCCLAGRGPISRLAVPPTGCSGQATRSARHPAALEIERARP